MASSYTSLLKFNQPGLGDAGWGTAVNSGFTALADIAIAGLETVDVASGNVAMTIDSGVSGTNDARNMVIKIEGTLTVNRSVTVPASTKLYFVQNSTSGAYTVGFSTATGSGVTVPQGKTTPLRSDGTNIVYAFDHLGSLTLDTALAATSGGTGQTVYAVGDLLYASTTTALSKLAAVATGNVLRSGGVGTAPAWGPVALATDVSGTLPIANGGTGQTTANAALNALLPSQATNNGKYLQTDGTNATWTTVAIPDVLATIAAASLGAIGTYAFMNTVPLAAYTEGTLVPGADLRYSGIYIDGSGNSGPTSGAAPTGTWRAMGRTQSSSATSSLTLFLRQA